MVQTTFNVVLPGLEVVQVKRDQTYTMDIVHAHPVWELYYLLNGECTYHFSDQHYTITKGSLVFIQSNCLHRTSAGSHERILISVDPALIHRYEALSFLFEVKNHFVIQFSEQEQQQLECLIQILKQTLTEQKENPLKQARIYLAALLCFIGDHFHETHGTTHPVPAKLQFAEKVIALIEQDYMNKITLDDLAEKLSVSKYNLSHAFVKVTGKSIFAYVIAVRLQHAVLLLTTTDLPVSQIAENTGFPSQAHFNRVFQREIGTTPLKYRQSYKLKNI